MLTPRSFFLALFLLAGALSASLVSGQTPVGTPLATFRWRAARLLADPIRPRLYAAVPLLNSVMVVDTDTLQILATLPVGPKPSDLAISRNGKRLYTANRGSAGPEAVSVIDLETLQALSGIDLPASQTWSIAAGRNKRLYVASLGQGGGLFQVDTTGDTPPQLIDTADYRSTYLQISGNGKTLYSADAGTVRLDVSTPTAVVRQSDGWPYDRGVDELRLSHNGLWLCHPTTTYSSITLYKTGDLAQEIGTFQMNDDPGPMAFSPDDTRLYEVPIGGLFLRIYDTGSFAQTQEVVLPWTKLSSYRGSYDVADAATDRTGHCLFVSGTSSDDVDATLVVATGTDAPTALPGVSTWANTPEVSAGGENGSFSISRSGDLSRTLEVNYTLGSLGTNDGVYPASSGKLAFAVGQAITRLTVVPPSSNLSGTTTLKLKLVPGPAYSVVKKAAKMLIYF